MHAQVPPQDRAGKAVGSDPGSESRRSSSPAARNGTGWMTKTLRSGASCRDAFLSAGVMVFTGRFQPYTRRWSAPLSRMSKGAGSLGRRPGATQRKNLIQVTDKVPCARLTACQFLLRAPLSISIRFLCSGRKCPRR